MRILVTGASGFLGRSIIGALQQTPGHEIVAQVRSARNADTLRASLLADGRVTVVSANLLTRGDPARILRGIDVVIHAAAGMRGAPAEMYLNTVIATRNLLDAMKDAPQVRRIVLVSSFAVYGTYDLKRGAVVNEDTPLEPHPEWRDGYALAKLHQEELAREKVAELGRELVVLRPGVIYGPGGSAFSNRVGANMFGWMFHLGGSNILPLSHVKNCADAIVLAAISPAAAGGTFNVHDDDLPSCGEYLRRFKRDVGGVRSIRIPYWMLMLGSKLVEGYHRKSRGQLPAAFTPYVTQSLYVGRRYDNSRLHSIGWKPRVSTADGLKEMFGYLRGLRA
jgi:nucleoside-diphosphate-sugar epimerase